jgi:hypothetical protein
MRRKPIYGVGINDAKYRTQKQEMVNGKRTTTWVCPFYKAWMSMLTRCYSQRFHERQPTYAGCHIHPDWKYFSAFSSWMQSQKWQGMELDKDILVPGNKLYSPDTCVFISGAINAFVSDRSRYRGAHPIGSTFHKQSKKFLASCNNPETGIKEYLGVYGFASVAHEAWRARKHQHACAYAEFQDDHRIAAALRIRYLPGTEHK